jgi:ABC-2 type transport system ATP-binding protein
VCGFDVTEDPNAVRRRLGYVMQQTFQSGRYLLTGREAVEIEAALYHVARREVRPRAAEVLELVGMTAHADRLTIIDHGRAVITGTPSELKRGVGGDVLVVSTPDMERLTVLVRSEPWVRRLASAETAVHVYVDDAAVALPALMRLALAHGLELQRLSYTQPTLDDVFLLHTGRELREAA